jgi:hypothetical protein
LVATRHSRLAARSTRLMPIDVMRMALGRFVYPLWFSNCLAFRREAVLSAHRSQ